MASEYRTGSGQSLTLKKVLGSGGENAGVFSTVELENAAVKIFLEPGEMSSKLEAMVGMNEVTSVCYDGDYGVRATWPIDTVKDENGQTVGYVMFLLDEHLDLYELSEPDGARGSHSEFSWLSVLRTLANLADTVSSLHKLGIVVGDLKPTNILVSSSGQPTIVDCDSFGFTGPDGNTYVSKQLTEEYASPERLSDPLRANSRKSDLFALALIVTQSLMGNTSPFVATPYQVTTGGSMVDNQRSAFPTVLIVSEPRLERLHALLPGRVAELAALSLSASPKDKKVRTSAADWSKTLWNALSTAQNCPNSNWHGFSDGGPCPWCELEISLTAGSTAHTSSPRKRKWWNFLSTKGVS